MKKEYIKWVIKKIRANLFAKTVIIAMLCSFVYLINKHIDFKPATIMLFNFACLAFEAVVIYQSVKESHLHEMQSISIAAIAFILNDFLDAEVFLSTFHIKLETFFKIIIICIIFRIIVSFLIPRLNNITEVFIEEWDSNPSKQSKKERRKRKNKVNEKDSSVNINNQDNLENDEITKQKTEIDSMPTPLFENKNDKSERLTKIGNTINFAIKKIIFIVILLLPIVFLAMVNIEKFISLFQEGDDASIQLLGSFGASFVLVALLWTILWGGIVSAVLWIATVLKRAWDEREVDSSWLIIYAGAFTVIALFLSKNEGFSIDGVADMLMDGKLLSYPIVLIIVFPIFMITVSSIKELFEKDKIRKVGRNLAQSLFDISQGILEAAAKFIQFVTSDFLTSIVELVEDDITDLNVDAVNSEYDLTGKIKGKEYFEEDGEIEREIGNESPDE